MREKQNSWNIYPSDQLFTAKWEPDTLPAKAIILIIHGISEHSGRYALFARELTEAGYIVYAYDQRGHGKTAEKQGLEGFAGQDGWNHMVHDVYDSVALIKKKIPDCRCSFLVIVWEALFFSIICISMEMSREYRGLFYPDRAETRRLCCILAAFYVG